MAKSDRVNLAHTTVLLIDDQPTSLDMLGSIVQGFGCKEQIKCNSAQGAVELLARRAVDLILIDCIMPEMDGYEFVRWLRRDAPTPTRYVPVIMILGHASQAKVHQGRDCGASFIVAKPLSPALLLKRIVWLGGEDRDFVDAAHYVGPDRRCLLYTSPSPRDQRGSRMPSSA